MPRGRPSSFTQQSADLICEMIAEGKTIREICAFRDMPAWETIRRWLRDNGDFQAQYARAREQSAEILENRVIEEAEKATDGEGAQIARVRIDALKWVAGKRAPKVYGDRVVQEHEGTVTHKHESMPDPELDRRIAELEAKARG